MRSVSRTLLFCLALLIGLTAQQMALARGQAMAAGQVVLCIGGQAVSVAVDDSGKPVGPAHICPDCALGFLSLLLPGTPGLPPPPGPQLHLAYLLPQTALPAPHGLPQPRGPPSLT